MKYEEAFEKLNSIKEKLENPNISLDEAVMLFSESMDYTKTALELLCEAEGKISVIKTQMNEFIEKPLNINEE